MRKICVITGTRAEYGLLSRLMKMIKDDGDTVLQVIATNMHLSKKYGNTYKEIEADGFVIDKKVPIIDESAPDSPHTTIASMSKAMSGFAEAFDSLKPDLIVILGDRYEMLAAASTALIYRIPIAHLYGGEITEGAFDDSIRHAITKMSHLNFTSTEEYRKRVIQMGEEPDRVFYVGALGVENIKKTKLMDKQEIESSIGFKLDKNTVLVTYHPVTLDNTSVSDSIDAFLKALSSFKKLRILFTMPNSDTGSKIIAEKINEFVKNNVERSIAFTSLGMKRYLSVIPNVAAVIGNSSSGVVEVPSFGIPTLDIGDRQKGRISCNSVWNCASDEASIKDGIKKVLSKDFAEKARTVQNPYDKPDTAENIFKVLKTFPLKNILQKHFYDL